MQRLCPPARRSVESGTADETTDSLADSILAERTPLEQDILRRYYVLGESPEEIKTNLRVSSRTIQQTIARARAAFRQKLQRSESA
jgi:DNA-directed RNA polymerase specialized sigma24 family protein